MRKTLQPFIVVVPTVPLGTSHVHIVYRPWKHYRYQNKQWRHAAHEGVSVHCGADSESPSCTESCWMRPDEIKTAQKSRLKSFQSHVIPRHVIIIQRTETSLRTVKAYFWPPGWVTIMAEMMRRLALRPRPTWNPAFVWVCLFVCLAYLFVW